MKKGNIIDFAEHKNAHSKKTAEPVSPELEQAIEDLIEQLREGPLLKNNN